MRGFPLRPAWAEVDLSAIAHNVGQFKKKISPRTRLMAIVKADGYGHGAVEVAREAVAAGVSFLGVGMVEEGARLREDGITAPILILGFTPKEYAPWVCEYNLTPSVFTKEEAEAFSGAAQKNGRILGVHIEVDTGMGRVGCFPCEEADEFIFRVASLPSLAIEGLYTHFASADHADLTFADHQLGRFLRLVERLAKRGLQIPVKHAANSAGTISMPEAHLDMVRLGISLYGLYPSDDVNRDEIALRPAMALKARMIFVKDVPAGTGLSYGGTYVTQEPSRIATLPLGYGDGYRRGLSNLGQVLVRGERVPIVGRVCMDQTLINITEIDDAAAGEEAVLFGSQKDAVLPVDEVARWLDTINYEVVTSISRRIPRIYLRTTEN